MPAPIDKRTWIHRAWEFFRDSHPSLKAVVLVLVFGYWLMGGPVPYDVIPSPVAPVLEKYAAALEANEEKLREQAAWYKAAAEQERLKSALVRKNNPDIADTP